MNHPVDILIVGGGPAGAAAGGLLAARGLSVTLCEQKPFPRQKVCGEFLAPQSRPILHRLGVLDRFDSLAGPRITRMIAHAAHHAPIGAALPPDSCGHFPKAIGRDILDALLVDAARRAGARILQPCHVLSASGSARDGFTTATSHGPIRSRALILAHGLAQRGDLSPAPAPAAASNRRTYLCFKAHFTGCDLPADTIALGGAPGAYIGLVRTGCADDPPVHCLAFVVRGDRLARHGAAASGQLAAILAGNPGFGRLLAGATRLGPWHASGPLYPGIRNIYHDGRFFVGNAAGEVHALIGEGMTLALRSAAILADALAPMSSNSPAKISAGLNDLAAAGAAYRTAWRRDFTPRYHAANLFANLLMRPPLATAAATLLQTFPPLLDYCIVRSGKWPA